MVNVHTFAKRKQENRKISMVTCYDFWSAKIINKSNLDCILVGDSLAVVMHGYDSTVHATVSMMEMHVAAVVKGAPDKFVIADLPFLSCSKGINQAIDAVQALIQAGASAVKIEGSSHQIDVINRVVEAGVPVMGHIGLTPQSIHKIGGHLVQGTEASEAKKLIDDAILLERAGCFGVVLECIPSKLGECISQSIKVPTIGIGAGLHTDGQVLVLHDMIGVDPAFSPKFLRKYANTNELITHALDNFHDDVISECFPAPMETYK